MSSQSLQFPRESQPVTVLFVSPFESDHAYMRGFFAHTRWKLHTAQNCREAEDFLWHEPIAVVITERELGSEHWQDLVPTTHECPTAPILIAVHRFSEDVLDDVLRDGAYDVLAKPFNERELSQVISFAWLRWRALRLAPAKQTRRLQRAHA